ncbi:hypothetical protein A2X44_02730 [candidate division CPR3 bacterium GWF2_35_18]|uniref:Actin-like protein ATPase involved in cell division-like protein n=1 Tax=candidate division CPR3 bacterium GW2011_GWF2_35_18 TaxID=1618350 RepID=A0A0G0E258_UNCC3|nr:MAG: Actin-like protein ATPase involved in cell division-like protein [candidate division CPR3 bacterium GW2011_GWF2_35_18]KKP86881.1 MAG: Actin-like protein ATPase involved in cell division-like protein [candidate division CPR3 bacterium GW2011_GWE2_35_7]OGB62506.1 MAG: hypothetical protein A2X44_02730 [candidate division CPR3 bacterium GWF2_35_18]OGB65550.1 MAG: hypothetical protein A2250_04310 [candidate division CPR3 bacterium RIFOXYA2_FULL_35_13]OGB76896.1 MAG: hypothetical protein A247
MQFFKRKPKDKAYLALDIGSEFVKAVVFNVKEGKVNVLGYGKHRQDSTSMHEGLIKDLTQVTENCELAITQAALQAGIRPAEAVVGIAGEQVRGFTTLIQFERAKPDQKISEKEMTNIIEKIQETSYINSLDQMKEEIGNEDLEIKLVNAALTHIMIDGERVEDPLGFRGKKIQVGVFNAYTSLVYLSHLQKIASKLEVEILAIAAEPYTLAEGIMPEDDLDYESLVIDIGGSTTDVVVIRHQDVVSTKMFALGGQIVTKEISEAFQIPYDEAEDLKNKYCEKKIDDEKQLKKLEEAITESLTLWEVALKITLKEFADLEYLPSNILLAGGGSLLPEIKEILKKVVSDEEFHFAKEFVIKNLTPQSFGYLSDQTGKLESTQEVVPLSLTMMILDLLEEGQNLDQAMKKGIQVFEK